MTRRSRPPVNLSRPSKRRIMSYALVFVATVIGWIVLFGAESDTLASIAADLIGLASTVVVAFCFQSAYDGYRDRRCASDAYDTPSPFNDEDTRARNNYRADKPYRPRSKAGRR